MPLVPALGRQRQAGLCEFMVSIVYSASSRTVRVTERSPVSNSQNNTTTNKIIYKQKNYTKN